MLTLKTLKEMQPNTIFASGVGTYFELAPHTIKWVAVRGGIHDWCIYYGYANMSEVTIAETGSKCFTKSVIKELVSCDKEAFNMYRY
jgi:hypothetical protein